MQREYLLNVIGTVCCVSLYAWSILRIMGKYRRHGHGPRQERIAAADAIRDGTTPRVIVAVSEQNFLVTARTSPIMEAFLKIPVSQKRDRKRIKVRPPLPAIDST